MQVLLKTLRPRFGMSRLAALLALIVFDLFLVCAAEHVGVGRLDADRSDSCSCLSVPDDGTDRLLDKLRQPEVLAVQSNPIDVDFTSCVFSALAQPSGNSSSPLDGPRAVSRLPLHVRLCVWLV